MNRNRYVTGVDNAVERGKVVYLSDYVEQERRGPWVIWERSRETLPRWLELLSNWVEIISTVAMAGCAVYWMWYCMCGL